MQSIRQPAVAGRFYPRDPKALLADIQSYLSPGHSPVAALGCVVPHAGYMYSGHVAGAVFARLEIPSRCILMCPNHTGIGHPLAIVSEGLWQTPLGPVNIDHELAENLRRSFPALEEDPSAHRAEHAAEVELPFLQSLKPGITFVPIALGTGRYETLEALGQAIAKSVSDEHERILILASRHESLRERPNHPHKGSQSH